jgi:hypothetical protein
VQKNQLDLFDAALDRAATKRKAKAIREASVEAAHRDSIKDAGGISFKFVSPQRRSVPDRLDLLPIPAAARHVVAQYVRFTECKRPGEKPTEAQQREHERLRALGYRVDVVDRIKPREDLFK